jgi:tetratricopeptide (TPR) repeat protein
MLTRKRLRLTAVTIILMIGMLPVIGALVSDLLTNLAARDLIAATMRQNTFVDLPCREAGDDLRQAELFASQALIMAQNDSLKRVMLGRVKRIQGDCATAIQLWQSAFTSSQRRDRILGLYLGTSLLSFGFRDQGLETLRTVRAAPYFVSRALYWVTEQQTGYARMMLDTALQIDKDILTEPNGVFANVLIRLGNLLRSQGQAESAEHAYQQAIQGVNPNNQVWGYRELATLYLGQNRVPEAIAALAIAHQIAPNDSDITIFLAELQTSSQQFDTTDGMLQDVIQRETQPALLARAYSALGNLYQHQDRLSEAVTAYQQAIRLQTEEPIYRVRLAEAYRLNHQLADAAREYATLVQMWPENQAFQDTYESLRSAVSNP